MEAESRETKQIEWLNTLIVMAQWDESLPLYFARLFSKPDQYQEALKRVRKTSKDGPLPAPAGDALRKKEWERLYQLNASAEPLRKLFADKKDPFKGAYPHEISSLADISDLTTDPLTMFYSKNGTFFLVLSAVRQRSELDTKELIIENLNKFYTLLDTDNKLAELLYKLACSNDWYVVLTSLFDGRDYTADEDTETKATLKEWNEKLTTNLRSILLKPTKLYRAPKKLVKLAWEKKSLFDKALQSVSREKSSSEGFELRRQVSNVAYQLFVAEAKKELDAVEAELQLLAVVARHYLGVRKFAKLDGLVYAWPNVASLAMANYANLEYVEDFFVERKPRPKNEELEARDVRELYELCESNPPLIRFLRLRPYFKEINEDELRRYRPLAPVTISDPAQPPTPTPIPPPNVSNVDAPPVVRTPSRVCEVMIRSTNPALQPTTISLDEAEFEITVAPSGQSLPPKGKTTFSLRKLLDRTLNTIGVTSEESLQSVMKGLFSGNNAEQVLLRGGAQLYNAIITQTSLEEPFVNALKGDGPVRLVIASEFEEFHYLPWEWLPRPGYSELLLSDSRFSIVRAGLIRSGANAHPPSLAPPIRVMGIFPNAPVGSKDISEVTTKALEILNSAGAQYQPLRGNDATLIRIDDEFEKFLPQIVHFEGYVIFDSEVSPDLTILFSSLTTNTEAVFLQRFETSLFNNKVQLLAVGRNESSRVYGNAGAILAYRLSKNALPATLAPIRAVDDVTAALFFTEFYRAFLAGNSLEQALYTARRKVASRGGDWTSFALFANPSVLDSFQPLPPIA